MSWGSMSWLGPVLGPVALAAACSALFAGLLSREPRVVHGSGLAWKKGCAALEAPPLLATLVQTHTGERVPLDRASPSGGRFDALLADHVTGEALPLDPRLLELLRTMSALYDRDGASAPRAARSTPVDAGAARIELVSGIRSPKLNEMLRKKGHHVASHSQHSLGHAVDFRVVVPCAGSKDPACDGASALAIDPRALERAMRGAGWDGGVGVYTLRDDWFVHADVGPHRSWYEGPQGVERGQPRP